MNSLERSRTKLDIKNYSRVIEKAYANSSTVFSLEEVTNIILYFFARYEDTRGESHPALSAKTLASLIPSLEFIVDPQSEEIIDLSPEDYPILIDKYFDTKFKKCDYHFSHFMSGDIRFYRYLEVYG